MSEALADVPADADLYLRPAALTAPGPDALPLAGGAVAFGAVEVIAARYGDRIRHVTLAAEVAAGRLPPMAERLPDSPRRDLPERAGWTSGRYGGEIKMLDRGGRDARAMVAAAMVSRMPPRQ